MMILPGTGPAREVRVSDIDALPGRLLDLRQRHWGEALTQPALGRLLGVKAPTISSWERGDAVPPHERIEAYASLFATPRSRDEGRILDDDELSAEERAERDALLGELLRLREQAAGTETSEDPLTFTDGAPIQIICGKLEDRPKTAGGHRWNYMALSAYADIDALVQLFGHIRAHNPAVEVRYPLAGRLEGRDLRAHLVVLGNLAMTQTDIRDLTPETPVHQVADDALAPDGEVFEVRATGERFGPVFTGEGEHRRVVEDIGMIMRMPSPVDPTRTLTVFSGVYTRGVFGAVRCLSDREIGPPNARWLAAQFGGAPGWGVLVRVRGTDHAIGTPRLSAPGVVAHAFTVPMS